MVTTAPAISVEQKRAALDEVLGSQTFAHSDQLRSFLKYVCEKEMAGRGDEIKEYLIGVEALGRGANYSPGEDATVRNRAYSLRNKLQDFYAHEKPEAKIRIELPKGSYCPIFFEYKPSSEAVEKITTVQIVEPISASDAEIHLPVIAPRRRLKWSLAILASLAVVIPLWLLVIRPAPRRSYFEEFWAPVLESQRPVLICTGQSLVFQLTGSARKKLFGREVIGRDGQTVNQAPDPKATIGSQEVVAIQDQYVGAGSAHALAQFARTFDKLGKPNLLRIGNEASFAELRSSPVISIGAFGNRWTMGFTDRLRFVFEEKTFHHCFIVDKANPGQAWGPNNMPMTGKVSEDYALISRVFRSETGEILIMAAGITQYGTRAAADFLTNPIYLEEIAKKAPAGWQKKNMQVVFSVKVIDNTPGPPTVLATHFW